MPPPDEVAAERAQVATEGWGARLLAEQADDGRWDGGTYRPGWADEERPFFDAWTATHFSLQSLWEYGLDPDSPQAQRAIGLVRENVRWDYNDEPYFDGETEPCINGIALAVGAYFGQASIGSSRRSSPDAWATAGGTAGPRRQSTVSSFHSTICVLEGLREWEAATGGTDASRAARATRRGVPARARAVPSPIDGRGRRPADADAVVPDALVLRHPARARPLPRGRTAATSGSPTRSASCGRRPMRNGMFRYENQHGGPVLFELEQEGEGFPSRWVTLRALRVLRWWDAAG